MRASMRPSLILVLSIGFLGFYGVLFAMTVDAAAEESASPQPIVTPLPTISPPEAPNHHLWSKHWAKQARQNRHALKKLSGLLSRPLPRLCPRVGSDATDAAWARYGRRCKAKAYRFVKLRKAWAKEWQRINADPVALGRALAAKYGWTGAQWVALYRLWSAESGWRVHADNPNSSAYGIPQALPGSKMGPGWRDSARVQIMWGLRYIKARWLTPAAAYAHLCACGWY